MRIIGCDFVGFSQLVHQIQKPLHRSGGFDADKHRARKLRIKLAHFLHARQQSIAMLDATTGEMVKR